MKNHNFKSYKVNYHIEYEIKSDNDTSVVIKTKRIDYIFAREEDAEEIANLNYSCFNEINVKDKVIYDKIINELNFYQTDEYFEKVSVKRTDTKVEEVSKNLPNHKVETVSYLKFNAEPKNQVEQTFDMKKVEV